jgi:hypothetical protein
MEVRGRPAKEFVIMKFKLLAATVAATLLGGLLAAAPAQAITGGEAAGEGHPNVGVIFWYDADGRFRCTATLVAPDVLLTADATKGYQPGDAGTDSRGRTWYTGTAYTHPQYSDFTDMANWNDVGVIKLDTPVAGITPAKIAGLNFLDTFAQPKLNSTLFTIVGYGTEVRKAESGPQKPTPMSYPLFRRVADAPGQKLTPQILQVNGNPNDNRGTGGSCFGDSGGPTFKDGKVVTVTSLASSASTSSRPGLAGGLRRQALTLATAH